MVLSTRSMPFNSRRRAGTTSVEMAFVLPVMLTLLISLVDLGWVIYAYGTVSEAAHCGARYAIVHGSLGSPQAGPTANDSRVKTIVQNNAVALDPNSLHVASSWPAGTNKAGNTVTVTVTYDCQTIIGRLIGLSSSTITVGGTSTMTITY